VLRRRTLSEGVAVEASIVARLLGLKLLTLDASILMLPPGVTATPPSPCAAGDHRCLADAIRDLDHGTRLLDSARAGSGVERLTAVR